MGTPKSKVLDVKVKATEIEGERTIVAVVSSSRLDRDYEYVDVPSLRLPLKGGGHVKARDLTGNEAIDIPMLLNHSFDVEDVIGSVRKAYLNEMGELVAEFGVSSRAKAQDLMLLIDEKHLDNALSITMIDYDYRDDTIYDAEVAEISLVFRGSNKDARILAVKSLIKGEHMSKDTQTIADKEAQLKALQEEIDAAKKEVAEAEPEVVEVESEEVEQVEAEVAVEAPAEADAEVEEEVVEKAVEVKEDIKEKEITQMADVKEIAKDEVVEKAVVTQEVASKGFSKNEARKKMVEHLSAVYNKEDDKAKKLAKEVASMKVIDGTSGANLFAPEILAQDILEQYDEVGSVASLVSKVDITGAETYRQLVETAGVGFQAVALGAEKQLDQPTWTPKVFEPFEYALIVAWLDGVAKRSPLAVYNQLVRYIATEYLRLQDKIILSYAGGTVGSETRPATGLVPILTTAGRIVPVASYESADIITGLGEAYGDVRTAGSLTLVANRKTWGRMATSVDAEGRAVFTVVGQQVNAGALGSFSVVVSDEIADDKVVVGHFPDYLYVTRGGLETLFSREATIGDPSDGGINLFTQDASALRANNDVTGGPLRVNSFVLLDFGTSS
jgi:HK97 family phage major capsid protein